VTYPRIGPLDRVRPASNSEDRRAAAASARTADPGAQLASLLTENWGPVWQLAARFGLPAAGPLMLPGNWTFH
jgi:protease-4